MNSLTEDNAEYWDKRFNRRNVPPTVAEFVERLNHRLGHGHGFGANVRFVITRTRSGAEVPSWQGPETARALVSRILQLVAQEVEMPAPFHMDPAEVLEEPPHKA